MNEFKEKVLLRIFTGETDKIDGKPVFEMIVDMAKSKGLAGVTVLKGIMGFGAHKIIHSSKLLDLSTDLPMVIEVVDEEEVIEDFLMDIRTVLKSGTATTEKIRVINFG